MSDAVLVLLIFGAALFFGVVVPLVYAILQVFGLTLHWMAFTTKGNDFGTAVTLVVLVCLGPPGWIVLLYMYLRGTRPA